MSHEWGNYPENFTPRCTGVPLREIQSKEGGSFMNQERRRRLEIILERLERIQSGVEEVLDEEEHYRERVPEGLQDSEQYEQSDAVCDDLSEALDGLADAVSSIVSVIAE